MGYLEYLKITLLLSIIIYFLLVWGLSFIDVVVLKQKIKEKLVLWNRDE